MVQGNHALLLSDELVVKAHTNDRTIPLASPSPADVTLEAPSDSFNSQDCSESRCRIHLVEGSTSSGTGETETILRARLRLVSLLLFAGFSLFFVWHTTLVKFDLPGFAICYSAHAISTLCLGALAVLLCSRRGISLCGLRIYEALIFGIPAAFFFLLQHFRTIDMVETANVHPGLSGMWLLLIFTYALYIPNTWRRAAVAVGLLAVLPILMAVLTAFLHRGSAELLVQDTRVIIEMVLVLGVTCLTAVWGVHTINTLRSEAHKARQLGQYKLKQLIGQGGMGEVYLAEHQLMKRPCAIKVIRPEKTGDPRVLARFEREVQTTAKLSHWNSVDIFDYGRADDGTFYYVMEFLPGMNLAELVRRFGALPTSRAIHLVRQACDALQEAHQMGLIHRDLKPANLFAASRGGVFDVAKLLDFGLAKPLVNLGSAAQLTQDGTITGSPLYMSPEQATGDREPDARSDIYSMGAVLYFLLTGRPPFSDEKPLKVLIAHAHEQPRPPSQFNGNVPDDVETVVLRCLAKNPDDRYQSAGELAAALDDCLEMGKWTREDARRWWQEHELSTPAAETELV
jgi:eukaryotic-like serine/threonine-protein kinase